MEVDYLYHAILAFDQRGTALDPITAVVISNGVELPDAGAIECDRREQRQLKIFSRDERLLPRIGR